MEQTFFEGIHIWSFYWHLSHFAMMLLSESWEVVILDLLRLTQISKIQMCCSRHTVWHISFAPTLIYAKCTPFMWNWSSIMPCILWLVGTRYLSRHLRIFCILGLLEHCALVLAIVTIWLLVCTWIQCGIQVSGSLPLLMMVGVLEVPLGTCFHYR